MFFHFLYPLSKSHLIFNLFKYITFRSIVAFIVASIISIVFGKYFILFMKKLQFGQIVRDDGPESHFKKAGTPTMGGVFIGISMLVALALSGNFTNIPFLGALFVGLSYFFLGYCDDYLKVVRRNPKGISAKGKLVWQISTAAIVGAVFLHYGIISSELYIPFYKGSIIDLGFWGYLIFIIIVVVGSSNAVNLTDGLDGLAIGPILTSSATLGLLAYVAGHSEMSSYLFIPYIEGAGELTVLTSSIIGASVGFLWYNSYPAQIFMGDVGSLSLGGILGTIAVLTKNEFLFVLIGGIFVIETLSVILQVASYKLRRKRIFKMAPIHHHFELLGWPEPKVIVRFWIISIFLAIVAIATLKMR